METTTTISEFLSRTYEFDLNSTQPLYGNNIWVNYEAKDECIEEKYDNSFRDEKKTC